MNTIVGLHNGYDEVAAQKIEEQLVELGARLGEAQMTIAYLEGALDEGGSVELLRRIKSLASEAQSDMSRLMCEARKQMRGE